MAGFDPETQASVILMGSDDIRALWLRIANNLDIADEVAGPILDHLNDELRKRGEEIEST